MQDIRGTPRKDFWFIVHSHRPGDDNIWQYVAEQFRRIGTTVSFGHILDVTSCTEILAHAMEPYCLCQEHSLSINHSHADERKSNILEDA
jgi:hypothetical protein